MKDLQRPNMVEGEVPNLVPCFCKFCVQSEIKPAAECELEKRVKQHMSDVAALVKMSPTVKLIVGSKKTEFSCHKILLSFYSSSFDKDIFGSPKGMITEFMNFPACSEQEMDAFVSWLYSGRLDRTPNQRFSCLLWIFGKTYGAPLFANDALQLLCDNIRRSALRVQTINFVYNKTEGESFLRLFIAEYFTHANPLSPSLTESWAVEKRRAYRTEWINLIGKGGDFMRDVAGFGLHNDNQQQAPWRPSNFTKYLETEPDRSPMSWKIGRTSDTPERPGVAEKRQHIEEQRGLKRTESGTEGQFAVKKQKESLERTPTRQKESKHKTSIGHNDKTPTKENDRTPTKKNTPNSNNQYLQSPVRQRDQPLSGQNGQVPARQNTEGSTGQNLQTPVRQNEQTPTRRYQSPYPSLYKPPFREPYVPPFTGTATSADSMDTDSLNEDDTPLRVRLGRPSL